MYMRTALICVLVMAAMLAVTWYGRERPYKEYSVREVAGGGAADARMVTFGGRILRYSRAGAEGLGTGMTEIDKTPFEMTGPEARVNGSYALVLDRGGREACLFGRDGFIASLKTRGLIGNGAVSSGGNAVLIVKDGDISAYFTDGQNGLLEAGITFEDFVPIDAAISGNEGTLVFAGIRPATGESEIRFYNKNNRELTASFVYENTVIPELFALPGGRVLAAGDNRVFIFRAGKEPKELVSEEMDARILMAVSDGKRAVLLTDGSEGGSREITVWDASGRSASQETDFEAASAALCGNEILLYNKSSLLIASVSGKIRFEGRTDEKGPLKACVRTGGGEYRVVTDYGAFEFDFK